MGFKARAKLGCQLSSLRRMARRGRQVANRHPPILEALKTCIWISLPHVLFKSNSLEVPRLPQGRTVVNRCLAHKATPL